MFVGAININCYSLCVQVRGFYSKFVCVEKQIFIKYYLPGTLRARDGLSFNIISMDRARPRVSSKTIWRRKVITILMAQKIKNKCRAARSLFIPRVRIEELGP